MTAPLRFEPDHEVIARLQTENYDLRDSYQNWLDASAEIDRLTAELAAARAEIARLRGGWVKCSMALPALEEGRVHVSIDVIARDETGREYPGAYCAVRGNNVGMWFECNGANIIEWRLMDGQK